MIWTTKDGTEIEVKDMASSHIRNAIRYLERRVEFYRFQFLNEAYEAHNFLNGDIAKLSVEQEIGWVSDMPDDDFLAYRFPVYKELCKELESR